MPDVKVTLTGTEDGSATVEPSDGGIVRIVPTSGSSLDVGLDYESPDRLVVKVGGSFTILHDSLSVSGAVSKGVFDGRTRLTGTVTYDISRDVSATISGSMGACEVALQAGLTIRF
jgi:hypothetical protein